MDLQPSFLIPIFSGLIGAFSALFSRVLYDEVVKPRWIRSGLRITPLNNEFRFSGRPERLVQPLQIEVTNGSIHPLRNVRAQLVCGRNGGPSIVLQGMWQGVPQGDGKQLDREVSLWSGERRTAALCQLSFSPPTPVGTNQLSGICISPVLEDDHLISLESGPWRMRITSESMAMVEVPVTMEARDLSAWIRSPGFAGAAQSAPSIHLP